MTGSVTGPRPERTHRVTVAIAGGEVIATYEVAEGIFHAVLPFTDAESFRKVTPATPLTIKVETIPHVH